MVVLTTDFGNFECMFAVDMCCAFVANTCCVRVCAREIERARGWPRDSERQRSSCGGAHGIELCRVANRRAAAAVLIGKPIHDSAREIW